MKTIFLSSFHPYISRNILATDAFRRLTAHPEVRLVLFVPDYKASYFRSAFGAERLVVEGVSFGPPSKRFLPLLTKRVAKYGLPTDSARIERYLKWRRDGKFLYFLLLSFLALGMRLPGTLGLLRLLDRKLTARGRYRDYFQRHRSDLVVATDVQNERDVEFLQDAQDFGVYTLGLVRSWDNLTLHGFLRVIPDTLLVPCPALRDEAVRYHGVHADHIRVVGVSHYDKYVRGPKESRATFLSRWGFDPRRPFIFCTLIGDAYIPRNDTDPYVLKLLSGFDANVLVRFSPTVPVRALEGESPYPNMAFDKPGVQFGSEGISDQELSDADDDRLMHALAFADVVVCGPSTIALDAIFFDRPVVLTGAFHPRARTFWEGAHRYAYSHFRAVLRAGAAVLPRSADEFCAALKTYLKNPSQDREGRARIRVMYNGPSADGQSGARIADEILQRLELTRVPSGASVKSRPG